MPNLYQNPANVPPLPDGRPGCALSEEELQENFDNFFADIFWEMESKYGDIIDMNVCDNMGDHLVGNVYIMFKNEEDAEKAVADLNDRWFNGKCRVLCVCVCVCVCVSPSLPFSLSLSLSLSLPPSVSPSLSLSLSL